MKKIIMVFYLFSTLSVFSQTWTETSGFGGQYTEWTVITSDDWRRIGTQYAEDGAGADMIYTDAFEIRMGNNVLSGTRPSFNGYYYLYGKWYGFLGSWYPVVAYGNSNTGRMEIKFYWLGSMVAGSYEYTTLFNRYLRRVNGE